MIPGTVYCGLLCPICHDMSFHCEFGQNDSIKTVSKIRAGRCPYDPKLVWENLKYDDKQYVHQGKYVSEW